MDVNTLEFKGTPDFSEFFGKAYIMDHQSPLCS
jgi:hypothetical protein